MKVKAFVPDDKGNLVERELVLSPEVAADIRRVYPIAYPLSVAGRIPVADVEYEDGLIQRLYVEDPVWQGCYCCGRLDCTGGKECDCNDR